MCSRYQVAGASSWRSLFLLFISRSFAYHVRRMFDASISHGPWRCQANARNAAEDVMNAEGQEALAGDGETVDSDSAQRRIRPMLER